MYVRCVPFDQSEVDIRDTLKKCQLPGRIVHIVMKDGAIHMVDAQADDFFDFRASRHAFSHHFINTVETHIRGNE